MAEKGHLFSNDAIGDQLIVFAMSLYFLIYLRIKLTRSNIALKSQSTSVILLLLRNMPICFWSQASVFGPRQIVRRLVTIVIFETCDKPGRAMTMHFGLVVVITKSMICSASLR
jgi:hypothetical protein